MGSEYASLLLTFSLTYFARYSSRRYTERRTWRQHLMRVHHSWKPVLPSLTQLYMVWKHASTICPPSSTAADPPPPMTADPPSPMMTDPPSPTLPSGIPPPNSSSFSLMVLDVYTLETSVRIPYSDQDLPIEALVKSGYLGNTPTTPSLAISLRTLELFRRIRLRKSSFSVEAFAKVVCDLYSVGPSFPDARPHLLIRLTSRCRIAGAIVLPSLTRLRPTSQFYGLLRDSLIRSLGVTRLIGG